jgi:hypothetical protein
MAEGVKKQQEWLFEFIQFHKNPQQYLRSVVTDVHTMTKSKSSYNILLWTENRPIII